MNFVYEKLSLASCIISVSLESLTCVFLFWSLDFYVAGFPKIVVLLYFRVRCKKKKENEETPHLPGRLACVEGPFLVGSLCTDKVCSVGGPGSLPGNVSDVWGLWLELQHSGSRDGDDVGPSCSACTLLLLLVQCFILVLRYSDLSRPGSPFSARLGEGLSLDCIGIRGVLGLNCFCANPYPYFQLYFLVSLRITWYTQAWSFSEGL